jgi:hypothetical protein
MSRLSDVTEQSRTASAPVAGLAVSAAPFGYVAPEKGEQNGR